MRFISFLLFGMFMLSASMLEAQAGKPVTKQAETTVHERVYLVAMQRGDYASASTALLYWMDARRDRKDLLDSLAVLYVNMNMIPQAAAVAQERLAQDGSNLPLRELLAQCYERLGRFEEARKEYTTLFDKLKKSLFLYKIATLYYFTRQENECIKTLDQLERLPSASSETVVLTYENPEDGQQTLPVLAAALNMRGAMELEKGQTDSAIRYFEQALSISPDFIMARKNLEKARKP